MAKNSQGARQPARAWSLTGDRCRVDNEPMPNRLALDEVHCAHGATMQEICDWQLPAHYGDVAAEYRAVREDVGVIDRSYVGKVVVTGRDRQAFLHAMLSNEIKALLPGQG